MNKSLAERITDSFNDINKGRHALWEMRNEILAQVRQNNNTYLYMVVANDKKFKSWWEYATGHNLEQAKNKHGGVRWKLNKKSELPALDKVWNEQYWLWNKPKSAPKPTDAEADAKAAAERLRAIGLTEAQLLAVYNTANPTTRMIRKYHPEKAVSNVVSIEARRQKLLNKLAELDALAGKQAAQ